MRNRRGSVLRKLTLLAISVPVFAVFSLAVPSAQASETEYQITLAETYAYPAGPTTTTYSGTGSIIIAQAPGGSGSTQDYTFGGASGSTDGYTTGDLISLSFTLNDGAIFNATGGCNVDFNGTTLNSIFNCSFPAEIGMTINSFGTTSYGLNIPGGSAGGTVSIGPGVAIAPEPSTWILWGTGLLAFGVILRKKVGVGSAVDNRLQP